MPINPNNEARDLVMSVFGEMSKGERNQGQIRVRLAPPSLPGEPGHRCLVDRRDLTWLAGEAARFRAASVDAGEKGFSANQIGRAHV